jgi:hypothetical protein
MIELKSIDALKWVRALSWIVLRRKLLFHVAEAPDVRDVLGVPGAFLLLMSFTAVACVSVTFCAQALGLQMIGSGYAVSNTTGGALADLAQQTLDAVMSVKDLHPNAWATALFLPMGFVLSSAAALAWLTRLSGAVRGLQAPRFQAWWLGMTGYLCLLVVVATVIGTIYTVADWLIPGLHFIPQVNLASFYLVVVLTLALAGAQALRRTRGQGDQNATWELVAILPILLVLLADLYILPKWAEHHQPSVQARSLSSCDLATSTCTGALTLSDSGVLELAPEARITLELASGKGLNQRATASLRAKWLGEPRLDGFPIQLQSGQLHYVRLRLEAPSTGDSCPSRSFLTSSKGGLVMSTTLTINGIILGSEGRSKFAPTIYAQLERPVSGDWERAAVAVCLAASPLPSGAALPASARTSAALGSER